MLCFVLILQEKIKNGCLDKAKIQDFRLEVNVMVNLKPHPNIIMLLGACTLNEDQLCLVTGICPRNFQE